MKIKYEIDSSLADNEVIITCKELTKNIIELERILKANTIESVFGLKDGKIFPIKPAMIERIYIDNRKTFVFVQGETYEVRNTLSELESTLGKPFVRISKSVIANTKHIRSIESEFSGNFTLKFISGTKEILSRSYVKNLKTTIGLEG
ncbi:LytTR family DNA-binding domain-containing protein [Candidatus Xianfuyuplasma coldseepsis]|uniref:LytTR family transcriptional regulator n=1 Tax=Candidatus Xianfuyuplasma coldseepsis TaxID=2782163 RepID=A0A7L7KR61_9MOLU|nr:LytTR family DNA-binding domain-containing protein [Xianfuyuplasma coldseepsis]QMS84706.1 LytTR family transcriptional regulator [Xianfuyuplasma coldseepsis]